jgi:hypothetical protein
MPDTICREGVVGLRPRYKNIICDFYYTLISKKG